MHFSLRIAAVLMILGACSQKPDTEFDIKVTDGKPVKIALVKDGQRNRLQCSVNDSITSSWPLNFPVYKFLKGDVNNDGQDDIAIGVIKPTRNDSIARKRLFVFQVRNKAIIPLWLGSSLGRPLEDFYIHTQDSVTYIRSIEKEAGDRYIVGEYQWFGFGLSFRKYIVREATLNEARDYLDSN
jgi:hypothetical protein